MKSQWWQQLRWRWYLSSGDDNYDYDYDDGYDDGDEHEEQMHSHIVALTYSEFCPPISVPHTL